MSENLKPCPFCVGGELSIYLKGINDRKYAVCCNTCDARGGRKQNKGRAVEAWNRRADNDCNIAFLCELEDKING